MFKPHNNRTWSIDTIRVYCTGSLSLRAGQLGFYLL